MDQFQTDEISELKSIDVTFYPSSSNSTNDTMTNDCAITSESSELQSDAGSPSSPASVLKSPTGSEDGDVKAVSDTENLNNKVAEISMVEEKATPSVEDSETLTSCKSVYSSLPKPSSLPPNKDNLNTRKKLLKTRRLSKTTFEGNKRQTDSGLYLYVDFHGHASKKGKLLRYFS